jgi:hypothetical protein
LIDEWVRVKIWWNDTDEKTEVLGENPEPVPLDPPQLPILQTSKLALPPRKFLLSNIHKFGSKVKVPQITISVKMFSEAKIVYSGHQSKSFKFSRYSK